jgi:hypothetical protein
MVSSRALPANARGIAQSYALRRHQTACAHRVAPSVNRKILQFFRGARRGRGGLRLRMRSAQHRNASGHTPSPLGWGRRRGIRGVRAATPTARVTDRFFDRRRPAAADRGRGFGHRAFSKPQGPCATGSIAALPMDTRPTRGAASRSSVKTCDHDGAPAKQPYGALPTEKMVWPATLGVVHRRASRPLGCFAGRHAATLPSLGVMCAIFKGRRAPQKKHGLAVRGPRSGLCPGPAGSSWSARNFHRHRARGRHSRVVRKSFRVPGFGVATGKSSECRGRGRSHMRPEKFRRPTSERRPTDTRP